MTRRIRSFAASTSMIRSRPGCDRCRPADLSRAPTLVITSLNDGGRCLKLNTDTCAPSGCKQSKAKERKASKVSQMVTGRPVADHARVSTKPSLQTCCVSPQKSHMSWIISLVVPKDMAKASEPLASFRAEPGGNWQPSHSPYREAVRES